AYIINATYQNNELEQAVDYCSQYLDYYPADKKMLLKKIAIIGEIPDFKRALVVLDKALKQFPGDADLTYLHKEILFSKANAAIKRKDTLSALESYNLVLKTYRNDTLARNKLINLNMELKNYALALNYIEAGLMYYPDQKKMLLKKVAIISQTQDIKKALTAIERAFKQFPDDSDLTYLHKEILFNEASAAIKSKDTLSTLECYDLVLKSYKNDTLARNQLINLNIELKNYALALKYIDSGVNYYPNQENLLLKKIAILQANGDTKQAYQLSKSAANNYPENRYIRSVNNELFALSRQNQIGLNYAITAFDQDDKQSWHMYSASYFRNEKFATLGARVNYADRNNLNGYQFEIEAYPTHGLSYSFINLSYAESDVFPKFRFSYSYFMPSKSWETEIGVRYLKTNNDNFLGVTAAIGKYMGPFWFNLKTFLTPNGDKLANSYTLTGRYYLNASTDDYFTAIAGYGFSPDDRGRNFEINSRLNMEALRFTVGYQRTFWRTNILGIFGTFNNQKYETNIKRNEYEAAIAFKHKF
ncbi:MAG: YaiO family outer membrane beta-barrel protein, partial [Pedobacter sp.]